jgi:hypothetical protein
MGWPPPIPMNYEGQKRKSMVNPKAGILVTKPY